MSYEDYKIGQRIGATYDSDNFYGVIQGAMRLADSDNIQKLKAAFPAQWEEVNKRYHAPGGKLPDE